ncbi:universal stress protein [Salinigranum sp.]|uniref:universal stress protein n=1 Tax=Salinigranum sp. TaxID=1966351 RepID=UPI003564B585
MDDAAVSVEKVGDVDENGVETVHSVLLPWADSTHAELAAETAATVARSTGAEVDVVRVVGSDADRETERARLAEAEAVLAGQTADDGTDLDVRTRLVEGDHVEETLVAEAAGHDVTAIGASREGVLQRLVFGATPEAVADRIDHTAIMCRRSVDVPSRLRRLFG